MSVFSMCTEALDEYAHIDMEILMYSFMEIDCNDVIN